MDFWDILGLHKQKIFAIIAIVIGLYWLHIPEEEPAELDITRKDKCELIIKNSNELHKNIIENCKKLLKEEDEIE